MNKIKNVARRLLGKEAPKPYVIDSVAKTSTGYCIVGWYATSTVQRVGLISNENKPLASDVTFIERRMGALQDYDSFFTIRGFAIVTFSLNLPSS